MSILPYIAVALITVCLILRLAVSLNSDNMEAVLFPTNLRVDALFAGVTLGYFFHLRRGEFTALSRWGIGALGLVLLLPSLLTDTISPLFASIQVSYNLAGFSLVVLWASTRSIRVPLLAKVGRYSYSIYLWHLVGTAFWRQHEMSFLSFSGDVIACVAIGIAMGAMIEFPMLHLRDRLFPSSQPSRNGSTLAPADRSAPDRTKTRDTVASVRLCLPLP